MSHLFDRFRPLIAAALEAEIRADVTLGRRLVFDEAGKLSVSYAPFDHIQHGARVVIVGITPGAQQAREALVEVRKRIIAGVDKSNALAAAKVAASFSGSMRTNLVALLDRIGIANWLGTSSTASL